MQCNNTVNTVNAVNAVNAVSTANAANATTKNAASRSNGYTGCRNVRTTWIWARGPWTDGTKHADEPNGHIGRSGTDSPGHTGQDVWITV